MASITFRNPGLGVAVVTIGYCCVVFASLAQEMQAYSTKADKSRAKRPVIIQQETSVWWCSVRKTQTPPIRDAGLHVTLEKHARCVTLDMWFG